MDHGWTGEGPRALPPLTPEQFNVMEALRTGWSRVKGTKRVFFALALIAAAIAFTVNLIILSPGDAASLVADENAFSTSIALNIASMIISPFVMAFSTGIALQRTAGFAVRFGHVTRYLAHVPAIFVFTFFWEVASVLVTLLISPTLGLIIRVLVAVLGIFVMYYIVDQRANAFRAFSLSGSLVMRNFGQTLLLFFALFVIGVAITVTLGIGSIWLGPLTALAMADMFRQAAGLQRVAEYEEISIG